MPIISDNLPQGRSTARFQRGVQSYDGGIAQRAASNAIEQVSAGINRQVEKKKNFDVSRAKSYLLQKQVDFENNLQTRNDYDKFEVDYDTGMSAALEEASAIIKDPLDLELFRMESGVDVSRGRGNVSQFVLGKQRDAKRATFIETSEANKQAWMNATDPKTSEALLDTQFSLYDDAVSEGFIDAEAATKDRLAWIQDATVKKASLLDPQKRIDVLSPKTATQPIPKLISDVVKNTGGNAEDSEALTRIAFLESRGDPRAKNKLGSGASGLFQFMPATAKQYGVKDTSDPVQSTRGALELLNNNRKSLERSLGRKPSGGELYLAHQQGAGGAAALLRNQDVNAVDVLTKVYDGNRSMAEKAVSMNGGRSDMTAGDFASLWVNKFENVQPNLLDGMSYYPKTNSWVDFIPMEERGRLIEQSKKDLLVSAETRVLEAVESGSAPDPKDMAYLDDSQRKRVNNYYEYSAGFKALTPQEEMARTVYFDQVAREYGANPKSILEQNVVDLRTQLNDGDFKKVLEWRKDASEGGGASAAGEGDVTKAIDYYMSEMGVKTDKNNGKETQAQFRRAFQKQISDFERKNGRAPAGDELYDLGDRMVAEVVTDPWGWFNKDSKRAYELEGTEDLKDLAVPPAEREQIINQYRSYQKSQGQESPPPLSEEQIKNYYKQKLGI